MYAITILLLATYAAAGQLKGKNAALRVYGGVDDSTGKYPYVVALKETYPAMYKVCTGSLIKDTWVLTAGHCLIPEIKYVQYGNFSKTLEQTKTKSVVLQMIRHPRYLDLDNFDVHTHNDIGLLMVEKIIGMSKYARISAVDYRTLLGHAVEYAGFGSTFFLKRDTKNKEQKIFLDSFRPLQIGEAVVTTCDDFPRQDVICARAKCSHSKQMVLEGDSGSPLIFDNKIIGLGFAVVVEEFIQTFTPVSPHSSWIHSVVTEDHQRATPNN